MTGYTVIKEIAGAVSSMGAGAVVANIVKSTTPQDINKVGKVLVKVGGFVIGGMVGHAASEHTKTMVDEIKTVIDNSLNNEEIE